MRAPLLCLPVTVVLAALLAACGDAEEVTTPAATATPVVTASPMVVPATAQPTSSVVPENSQSYVDPDLGFSLRIPPDLVAADLTPDSAVGGAYLRVLDYRSPVDSSRAVSVEVYSNVSKLTAEEWAVSETACLPGTVAKTTAGGTAAVSCTEQATEIPNALVVFEHSGRIYEIGSLLPATEFDLVVASLRP